MRVYVTEGSIDRPGALPVTLPSFTIDFITANVQTHAALTPCERSIFAILQAARMNIVKLLDELATA